MRRTSLVLAKNRSSLFLIGAGHMGRALLEGWFRAGLGPVTAVEPAPSPALRKLARKHPLTILPEIVDLPTTAARACVVALKPQVLKSMATELRGIAEAGTLMVSIAAGSGTRGLAKAWGRQARIVRAMPNTPGAIGQGITALYATAKVTAADRKLADRLLGALGQTIWVEREGLIDAATAVSGSGPAYVFLLVEALTQAGIRQGLPRAEAARFARQTIIGAGALLAADKSDAAQLRRNVTSPGGTTEAALGVLMAKDGLSALMERAVAAAYRRARELSA